VLKYDSHFSLSSCQEEKVSNRENRPLPRMRSRLDVDCKLSHEGESDVSHVTSECDEEVVDIEDSSLGNNKPLVVSTLLIPHPFQFST
jgi:hypothetical protein